MPRFKQPLRGLPRLSDREGGVIMPEIISTHWGAGSFTIPALQSGDLFLLFWGNSSDGTVPATPSGFIKIAEAVSSGTNLCAMIACYRQATSAEPATTLTTTGADVSGVLLRGAMGIGGFDTFTAAAPGTTTSFRNVPNALAGSRIIGGNVGRTLSAVVTSTVQIPNLVMLSKSIAASINSPPPTGNTNMTLDATSKIATISIEVLAA